MNSQTETHKPLQCRAGILVYFIGCTNTRPDRYAVKIRDFPTRVYSSHKAPNDMSYTDKPEHFARLRLQELGLDWRLSGLTYLDGVGYVFTLS